MPRGRPTKFNADMIEVICCRIASGESLNAICRDAEMPCYSAVLNELERNPDFVGKYVRAREAQADLFAAQIVEIADNSPITDSADAINRARLKMDARKWATSKIAPKKYGDKITQEISGIDGGAIEIADARAKLLGK